MKNKNILYADEHVENSFEILKKKISPKANKLLIIMTTIRATPTFPLKVPPKKFHKGKYPQNIK